MEYCGTKTFILPAHGSGDLVFRYHNGFIEVTSILIILFSDIVLIVIDSTNMTEHTRTGVWAKLSVVREMS